MLKPSYQNYSQTVIRVEKTQADISKELGRYGVEMIQHTQTERVFSVAFKTEVEGQKLPLTIRIDVPYERENDTEDKLGWKKMRIKYRALFYYVKALLIAWDSGVKTFSEIFLPHLVLPGGRTVVQDLLPKYQIAIEKGEVQEIPLLPGAEEENENN